MEGIFNIHWDCPKTKRMERAVECLFDMLLKNNCHDALKGLKLTVRENEIMIVTDYSYYIKNGLVEINISGGKEIKRLVKTREIIVRQPLYHTRDDSVFKKQTEGYVQLRLNYIKPIFI